MFEFISAGGLGEATADAGSRPSRAPTGDADCATGSRPPASSPLAARSASEADAGVEAEPLLAQGARMRDALLAELLACPGLEVLVADAGLVPLPTRFQAPPAGSGQSRLRVLPTAGAGDLVDWLRTAAAEVDLAWVTAPETDDILLELCAAVPPARWIGCSADAIRLASSKTRTREHLAAHGLPVPTAWTPAQSLPSPADHPGADRWVLKPDDGAGGEHTRVFPSFAAARAAFDAACEHAAAAPGDGERADEPRWTLEAWVEGEALSLSLLCSAGHCEVLSVNRQRVAVAADGRLGYAGVDTGVEPPSPPLQVLAARIATAVPGLAGFVGIDLVRAADGRLCVIEINPRLTCAYAGLVPTARDGDDDRQPALRGRSLAAEIIAAHDAALATPAIDTADVPTEHA